MRCAVRPVSRVRAIRVYLVLSFFREGIFCYWLGEEVLLIGVESGQRDVKCGVYGASFVVILFLDAEVV